MKYNDFLYILSACINSLNWKSGRNRRKKLGQNMLHRVTITIFNVFEPIVQKLLQIKTLSHYHQPLTDVTMMDMLIFFLQMRWLGILLD